MTLVSRPWGIAVLGTGIVRAAPDLARIRFRVARLEQTPADAVSAATEAVARVRAALRDHTVAAVQESRLDLRALYSYGDPTPTLVGYQCQAAFAAESTDLDGVPQLVVELVAAGAREIDSLEFDLRSREDLHAEAGRRAVAAARTKAAIYAEAAGRRLGAVLHIEDADGHSMPMPLAAKAMADSGEDLAPGEIVIAASVVVGFALTGD